MEKGDSVSRLRIYLSSTDKYEHKPLYEVLVYAARNNGISGATVIKGIMGYGASSEVYTAKMWELTEKLPLVVEMVDEHSKIESFLTEVSRYFEVAGKGHIITMEETTIVAHKPGKTKIKHA